MNNLGLAKALLEKEAENAALRAVLSDLMARDPKNTTVSDIFEKLVTFEMYNLREGRRSLRWIGMSHNEFKTCKEAAADRRFFEMDGESVVMIGPGGRIVLHALACPDGCYFQIREPLVVSNSVKVFEMARSAPLRTLSFNADLMEGRDATLTLCRYDIRPMQSTAIDVGVATS